MPAIEYNAIFFKQIAAVFFVRTKPDSSIANPAAISITRKPCTRKEKVFKTKAVSSVTEAYAGIEKPTVMNDATPKERVNFKIDVIF